LCVDLEVLLVERLQQRLQQAGQQRVVHLK